MIKNLVYLAAFTFVIILSWIGFGIYHAYTSSTITHDTSILISPIPAHFNLEIVRDIANRKVIPADLASSSPVASTSSRKTPTSPAAATPTPTTSLTSSSSARLSPPPAATGQPLNNL